MSTVNERVNIINSVQKLISERLFHPSWNNQQIEKKAASVEDIRGELESVSEEEFEKALNAWLCGFGLSHVGFFHISAKKVPPQFAIGAELRAFPNGNEYAWFVQHVLAGGVADEAGIRLGDAILAVNGRRLNPPDEPRFQLGRPHDVLFQREGMDARTITIHVPLATEKDRPPMVSHEPLSSGVLEQHVGVVKVTAFPGAAGFEFAHRLDDIVARLKARGCNRLIVDLRGNPGGGLGSLRLMSYLVPDRRPTGYSLTRRGKERGKSLMNLARIGRIPSSKVGLWMMAFRFGVLHRDRSLALWTEGLGTQPFHGRVVLLVDEFTRSAAEMIAAFASRLRVASLVGARTPGQVLGAANFRVGGDYRLRIPVTAWYTPDGELIEGKGVIPQRELSPSVESLRAGIDVQMEEAVRVAFAFH